MKTASFYNHLTTSIVQLEDSIIGLDAEGVVQYWNQGAENLYGILASSIKGKVLLDHLQAEVLDIKGHPRYNAHSLCCVMRITTPSGKVKYIDTRFSEIRNNEDEVLGSLYVGRDITPASIVLLS